MQTTITDQIKAVQNVRETLVATWHPDYQRLNDAASTLEAIKMFLSGDIGRAWTHYLINSDSNGLDRRTNGEIFVDFLRERGLPITK